MNTEILETTGEQAAPVAKAYNSTKGELTVTVIKPGFNKGRGRYYPAEVLKRDFKIFEGAKMFADHATDSEKKQRPEGSVNNWVASLTKVWVESDGTVKGTAVVIDPQFKAKLEVLGKKNLLGEMGISIRAAGEAETKQIDGRKTDVIESLTKALSVDFVTFAGAGGKVDFMESAEVSVEEAEVQASLKRSWQRKFENYRALGLTEAEAAIAADIEGSVLRDVHGLGLCFD